MAGQVTSCADRQLPRFEQAVVARAVHRIAARCKEHGIDGAAMGAERGHRLAVGRIPDADRFVAAAARQELPVVIERQSGHRSAVSRQTEELLAVGRVPDLDRAVLACAGQPVAVGAQRQGVHSVALGKFAQRRLERHVPDLGRIVRGAGGDEAAV